MNYSIKFQYFNEYKINLNAATIISQRLLRQTSVFCSKIKLHFFLLYKTITKKIKFYA